MATFIALKRSGTILVTAYTKTNKFDHFATALCIGAKWDKIRGVYHLFVDEKWKKRPILSVFSKNRKEIQEFFTKI